MQTLDDFRKETDDAIAIARQTSIKLTVKRKLLLGSKAAADKYVELRPIHGSCLFGASIAGVFPDYVPQFTGIFDLATVPTFWNDNVDQLFGTAQAVCNWCASKNIMVALHPAIYALDRVCAMGLKGKDMFNISNWRDYVQSLITRLVGLYHFVDVVNEPLHTGLLDTTPFTWFPNCVGRRANEYGLENDPILNQYIDYVFNAQAMNIPINIIGAQFHALAGSPMDFDKVKAILIKMREARATIHITECSFPSGPGEQASDIWTETQQALHIECLYRRAFADPFVNAITHWNLMDGDPISPTRGLFYSPVKPKPAWTVLQSLLKQWRRSFIVKTGWLGDANFNNIWKGIYGVYVDSALRATIDTSKPLPTIYI